MVLVIQMFMLLTGALIIILTKTNPASISKNEVFRSGMIAIVAVYGIAWMAETMFGAHMSEIQGVLGEMVKEYPWAYAIVLLLVSKFVNSQAAALAAIVPVALAIGVDPAYIVASAPACYGYYILPTYPSDLAAIQFDRSGTTHRSLRHQPQLYSAGVDWCIVRLRLDLRRDVRVLINALCVPPVTTRHAIFE
ncbi:Anaerobic C4-dicarboxylate transporter DcuB [Escherichia coli]|nr:Anaerobic C4-dicarboxylate transporter DcuB [Escherichia coli]